ncbi:hypothetical protein HMI55_004850 [Coelomomyces lativittatus]|nr:hypothetical protein HMI55_004850 [Coelomomyces lativittatus]
MQFKNNVALLAVLFVAGVSSSPSYIPYSEPEVQTPEQESVSPSQIDTVPVPLETSGTTNEIFIPEPVTTIPQPPPTRTSAYLPPVHLETLLTHWSILEWGWGWW